jgi:uncharacterized membrane protein
MKKHLKFIIVSTITFIAYAVFGFFWHNNLFPAVYYANPAVLSMEEQNVILMNFAMALLTYGLTYFIFKSIKPETTFLNALLWGIYYGISVIGFFSFWAVGAARIWEWNVLILDMVWAVVSGGLAGILVFVLYKSIMRGKAEDAAPEVAAN